MGTESQGVDYSAVLADLEARKAQIESAIAVIRGLMGTGLPPIAVPQTPPAQSPSGNSAGPPNGPGVDIQNDTFFGLTIMDAARKYMAMRKRPVTVPDVANALREGGQVNSTSENFNNTVAATLSRSHSNDGPVVRVTRGAWGLREWYSKPRVSADTE